MANALYKPRIEYPSGGTVITGLEVMGVWDVLSRSVGGYNKSASGVAESFKIRREELVRVRLRFMESSWATILTFVKWGQDNPATAFLFRFNAADVATQWSVYLEEPAMGQDILPDRVSGFPACFELELLLRSSIGSPITTPVVP